VSKIKVSTKFKEGDLVHLSLRKNSRKAKKRPYSDNLGKTGRIAEIYIQNGQNFYLVKFGSGVWDEICAPEEDISLVKAR
jgi:hypothetical protein